MKIGELLIYPLVVVWGLLTAIMFFIHPEATSSLLKKTAQKSGVLNV